MKLKVEMEVTYLVTKEVEVPDGKFAPEEDMEMYEYVEELIREEVEADGLQDYEVIELLEYEVSNLDWGD